MHITTESPPDDVVAVRHRGDRPKRQRLVGIALLVVVVLAAAAVVINRTLLSSDHDRPELQGIIDSIQIVTE